MRVATSFVLIDVDRWLPTIVLSVGFECASCIKCIQIDKRGPPLTSVLVYV